MGLGDTFAFYAYTSDDGDANSLKLSAAVAAAAGFTTTVNPRTNPPFIYGKKNARHVYGNDGAGHRTKIPCPSPDSTLFVSGLSFTIGSRTYQTQGRIGEARKLNSVP